MTDNKEYTTVKPSDKLVIIAPRQITMYTLDHMCSAVEEFKCGTTDALILPHGTKLCIVDKDSEIELKIQE